MPKNRSITHVLTICLLLCATVNAEETAPTLESPAELRSRREAIYQELDRNVDAVKQCFELLDETPETDTATRAFLDAQIQQYDDRSSVLHGELTEIERHESLAQHRIKLLGEIKQLEEDAKQLKKGGHVVPAQLRLAKAASLKRSLEDGSWKILADDEWRCDSQGMNLVSVLQLNAEIEDLKLETAGLRAEVKRLRETVERLERLVGPQPVPGGNAK